MFIESSRIREDLMKILETSDPKEITIAVREWQAMLPQYVSDPGVTSIDNLKEFRGFVFNGNFNAVSQYCYYQYFETLQNERKNIENLLRNFYEKEMKGKIPFPNCIVDFVICDGIVKVIEFNPFFNDTGACLFSWKNAEDVKIIKEGPFEFRLLESAVDYPLECFDYCWQKFIHQYRGRDKKKSKSTTNQDNESNYYFLLGLGLSITFATIFFNLKKNKFL